MFAMSSQLHLFQLNKKFNIFVESFKTNPFITRNDHIIARRVLNVSKTFIFFVYRKVRMIWLLDVQSSFISYFWRILRRVDFNSFNKRTLRTCEDILMLLKNVRRETPGKVYEKINIFIQFTDPEPS